jgi:predicted nucleic acid-binding protein
MAMTTSGRSIRRVYLDLCALNRLLDDQHQMRIRLEGDAVSLILTHVRNGMIRLAVSPMHGTEIAANPDAAKRQHLQILLAELGEFAPFDPIEARQRAEALSQLGMGPADAAHVAFAEHMHSDFVSVDDRLLRQLRRTGSSVWFGTPTAYCDKEDLR